MNILVIVCLGILVSIVFRLINKNSPFTIGTIILGTLGALLGALLASVLTTDFQFTSLIVPTIIISATGSLVLILLQKFLIK
jgi:uncharacterized membrane protein YeaQ/YmgE (transglycosylase-associated protein family)